MKTFILYCFLVTTLIISFAQDNNFYSFEHINNKNGLSNNSVTCIRKDRNGFMWFATERGLNRYDGYNFKHFFHNPSDSNSIAHNIIWNMHIASNGLIWLATQNGLSIFNPETETATNYYNIPNDSTSLVHNALLSILEDSKGRFWIGTADGHLVQMNPKTGKFINIKTPKYNLLPGRPEYIVSLLEDEGEIWIGKYDGLSVYNIKTGKFRLFNINKNIASSLHGILIRALYKDDKYIYIGSRDAGLDIYNKKTKTFSHIKGGTGNNDLTNSSVYHIIKDKEENLWIGLYNGGINIINKKRNSIKRLNTNILDFSGLNNNDINSFYKDDLDNIWTGTYYNGINIYKPNSLNFSLKILPENIKLNRIEDEITSQLQIDGNNILICSYAGIYIYSLNLDAFKELHKFSEPVYTNNIIQDSNKNLWISTRKGLYFYNFHKNYIKNFFPKQIIYSLFFRGDTLFFNSEKYIGKMNINTFNFQTINLPKHFNTKILAEILPNSQNTDVLYCSFDDGFYKYTLSKNKIDLIKTSPNFLLRLNYTDNDSVYYFNSPQGIVKFNCSKNQFHIYMPDLINLSSLVNIIRTKNGDLYCNTSNGNYYYNKEKDLFEKILNSPLNDLGITANIIEDMNNNIWFIGDILHIYNPKLKSSIINLSVNQYNHIYIIRGHLLLKNGDLALASSNGLLLIKSRLKFPPFNKNIRITSLFLNKIPQKKGSKDFFEVNTPIHNLKKISIRDNVKSIEIHFSSMNFSNLTSLEFIYKIEGLDDKWNTLHNSNILYLNYLPPGDYKLLFQARDLITNEKTSINYLNINVIPPFYQTLLFKVILILTIILFLLILYRYKTLKIKRRNELLQQHNNELHIEIISRKAAEMKAEKLSKLLLDVNKELEELLYISTHDLRSPLVNINAFSKELGLLVQKILDECKNISEDEDEEIILIMRNEIPDYLSFIRSNTEKMDKLLKALLTYSRIRRHDYNPSEVNVCEIIDKIILNYEKITEAESIIISRDYLDNCIGDARYLFIAFDNIVNNSIKYMPVNKSGEIHISSKIQNNYIVYSFSDNGNGINKDYVDKVFNIFYRLDPSNTEGIGIGLPIVSKIIKIHSGKINLITDIDEGVIIEILIPLQ